VQEKIVTLYKNGNTIYIDPTSDYMFELLKPVLSFTERKCYFGYEATQRKQQNLAVFELQNHSLLDVDHKQRIVTFYGFFALIRQTLTKAGYTVKFKDLSPMAAEKLEPRWKNISSYKLRANQNEFLQKILANRCGRFDCPPGFGKSFMIGLIAALLPKATIDVVTRRVSVLRDRIYPELCQMVGDVGIVGGSKNVRNKRVMCYTVGSLGHSPATSDFLIGDECHELSADKAAGELVRWQNSRNFGLSASHDLRWDGKDFRNLGLFGPVIFKVNYAQAQSANMVVPIHVKWTSVVMDQDPCMDAADIQKKRQGIWCNDYRNRRIAEDAQRYDDNTQVLITVETIEHALNLKKQLPNFTLVYMENGLSKKDIEYYARRGFCKEDEPLMDLDRRQKLTQDFEKGVLKKVICTTVWNVGVSFNSLAVLIRADGGGSPINDIQIPGRVSRISADKPYGQIHDYLDQFNYTFKTRAKNRSTSYALNNWQQDFPSAGLQKEYHRITPAF